jgi:hypothetical protein
MEGQTSEAPPRRHPGGERSGPAPAAVARLAVPRGLPEVPAPGDPDPVGGPGRGGEGDVPEAPPCRHRAPGRG